MNKIRIVLDRVIMRWVIPFLFLDIAAMLIVKMIAGNIPMPIWWAFLNTVMVLVVLVWLFLNIIHIHRS